MKTLQQFCNENFGINVELSVDSDDIDMGKNTIMNADEKALEAIQRANEKIAKLKEKFDRDVESIIAELESEC